jgi:Cohesin domain
MTPWGSMIIRRSVASVVFVCAMFAASASAGPILSINPATTTVSVGDSFTLNIDIAGVDDLFSYNFDLLFDPEILRFDGIAEGEFLKSGTFPGTEFFSLGEETPGLVSFITNSIYGDEGVTGSGTLAIATFFALMPGETLISFPTEFPNQLLFSDSSDSPIGVTADEGLVQVNASTVPDEPSAMILLVAALAVAACRCFTRP